MSRAMQALLAHFTYQCLPFSLKQLQVVRWIKVSKLSQDTGSGFAESVISSASGKHGQHALHCNDIVSVDVVPLICMAWSAGDLAQLASRACSRASRAGGLGIHCRGCRCAVAALAGQQPA